jgi:XTP/dITP diphosphohydrolase
VSQPPDRDGTPTKAEASSGVLVVATGNRGKAAELAALLAGAGLPSLRVTTLADHPPLPPVVEDGDSYEANALKKARAAAAGLRLPALADDSGLEVDALGGRPGLHSARYLGPGASPAGQVAGLLRELAGVPPERRTARFVAALAVALPDGREATARGIVEGTIAAAPRGTGGFGYDPIFVPRGGRRTYAEMPAAEKARTSHRAAAARAIAPALARLLGA